MHAHRRNPLVLSRSNFVLVFFFENTLTVAVIRHCQLVLTWNASHIVNTPCRTTGPQTEHWTGRTTYSQEHTLDTARNACNTVVSVVLR